MSKLNVACAIWMQFQFPSKHHTKQANINCFAWMQSLFQPLPQYIKFHFTQLRQSFDKKQFNKKICQIIDFKLYKCILFLKLQPSSIHFNIYLLSTMYIFSSLKSITYLNSKLIQPKKNSLQNKISDTKIAMHIF